jgi:hypothetical protein
VPKRARLGDKNTHQHRICAVYHRREPALRRRHLSSGLAAPATLRSRREGRGSAPRHRG